LSPLIDSSQKTVKEFKKASKKLKLLINKGFLFGQKINNLSSAYDLRDLQLFFLILPPKLSTVFVDK